MSKFEKQDRYKDRMHEAGFERAETWIHPDDKPVLRRISGLLREWRTTGEPFSYTLERNEAPPGYEPVPRRRKPAL